MKKIYSLLVFLVFSIFISAQSTNIYEASLAVKIGGGSDTFLNLENIRGNSLGTFSDTNSLVIAGGQNKTSKCAGGNVTGGNLYYRFYDVGSVGGAFTAIPMSWVSNDASINGCGAGNQTWQGTSGTTNIASGLANGTYILEVYTNAPGTPTTSYFSSYGNNFKMYFEVNNTTLSVDNLASLKNKSIVADGKLFTAKKGNLKLQIYDFSGKLVKTMEVNSKGNPIEISVAKKGHYILAIDGGTVKEIVKFSH